MTTSQPFLLQGRYELREPKGSGGMAVVYSAFDTILKRPVAVKVLRADYSKNKAFCEQFQREATAAANLSHPNIVTVHDFGNDAGRQFIVMELVDGDDLKSAIRKKGRYSNLESVRLMIQACHAIGYAHRAGIVHCDVKPHNMLITPDQHLKMTDFGIARALKTINPDERSEEVWGSPEYFSPEQAGGLAPSPASDVYSLGVVLYEMLTGRLPFESNNRSELVRMHREQDPPPPKNLYYEIAPDLDQTIRKVLSKTPAQRYRTADQLGRVLEDIEKKLVEEEAQKLAKTFPARSVAATATQPAAPFLATQPVPGDPAPGADTGKVKVRKPAAPASPNLSALFSLDIIILGLVALAMVLGLIPFGLIWYFSIR